MVWTPTPSVLTPAADIANQSRASKPLGLPRPQIAIPNSQAVTWNPSSYFACRLKGTVYDLGKLTETLHFIPSNYRNKTVKTLPQITIFNLSFPLHILIIFPYILIKTKQNKGSRFISGKETFKSFPFPWNSLYAAQSEQNMWPQNMALWHKGNFSFFLFLKDFI